MEFFRPKSIFLKLVCILGLIFILYGYCCRLAGIYFFWESKTLGWFLLFIALIGLIQHRLQRRKEKNSYYKGYKEKAGITVIVFSLVLKIVIYALISTSDAFVAAKEFLSNDATIGSEIGKINSFSIVPLGGMSKSVDSTGIHGAVTMILILKGEKKFKQLHVSLIKYPEQGMWKVSRIDHHLFR